MVVIDRREKAIAIQNKSTNIIKPHFDVRYYVLILLAANHGHKPQYEWFEPLWVKQVHSPPIYNVAEFHGTDPQHVHATQLKRYCSKLECSAISKKLMKLAHYTTAKFEAFDSFGDIAEDVDQAIMIRVLWDILPEKLDSKWHMAEHLYDDVSDMFLDYIEFIQRGPNQLFVRYGACLTLSKPPYYTVQKLMGVAQDAGTSISVI